MKTNENKIAGIIGTGDYGRSLAIRLLRCGYKIIMGSRNPDPARLTYIDERLASVQVKSTQKLLEDPTIDVIFLAIHSWNFVSCLSPHKDQIKEKVFIDISNRERPSKTESNAENLAQALPDLRVVKAFNTLSAYAMESDTFGGAKQVLIASDDSTAREKVSTLAREMGFTPVDYGVLRAARELEAFPLTLMYGWGWPSFFTALVFLFWTGFAATRLYLSHKKHSRPFSWDDIPLEFLDKQVALTAITLLAVSYLPGCMAAFLQMINGTKYKRFPDWFDLWLKSRKMLGLYALLFSIFHVMLAGIPMSPSFVGWWYNGNYIHLPANASGYHFRVSPRMTFKGEMAILIGIVALLLMSLLGLSSLPSVGAFMNWREWRFVQSHLGYVTLFLVTAHVAFPFFRSWMWRPSRLIMSASFLCCLIPFLVLLMKFILLIPCVGGYVDKIRRGWERKISYQRLTTVL